MILDDTTIERLIARHARAWSRETISPEGARTSASAASLAGLIDHTALKADTTDEQILLLCEDARRFGFASVCVNPSYVPTAARALNGTDVAVCSVIGFPLGASTSAAKAFETRDVIQDGATEVDMVINIGRMKSARYEDVESDIRAVVEAARDSERSGRVLVKVILETALLTDEEKVIACILAGNSGADFVKTSTGFSTGGATVADVALMRRVVGNSMGVKASGGIRSRQDAELMIRNGASRLGASASVAVVSASEGTPDHSY